MENYKSIRIPLSELKPGFVLNELLDYRSDLRPGHVLTPDDIKVFQGLQLTDLLVLRPVSEPQTHSEYSVTPPEPKTPTLQPDSFLFYLTDQSHNQEIRKFNREYIDDFRGVDDAAYQEEKFQYLMHHFQLADHPEFNRNRSDAEEALRKFIRSHRDVTKLKSLNPLQLDQMLHKIEMYGQVFELFFQNLLEDKVRYTGILDSVVLEMVMDFAQLPTRSLLALFSQHFEKPGFFVHHSLQVTLLALILAVETTYYYQEQAELLLKTDLKNFMRITRKVYNLEDMIKLGIAGLLHDIDIKRKIPDISEEMQFEARHFSIIDLHPSNGYQLARTLGLDFEVQSAIYQHHERFDASGYPHNISPHLFTKYTPVLMFAEYYIEMTTQNPFNNQQLNPHKAVIQMLTQHKPLLDETVLMSYLRSASMYPIGTWVQLSDSTIGMVFDIHQDALEAPIVRVLYNQDLQPLKPSTIDLLKDERKIIQTLRSPQIHRILEKKHPQFLET